MLKLLVILVTLFTVTSGTAQQTNYTIDVLIDSNAKIYFQDKQVALDDVAKMTRSKVEALKFVEGKEITYRIFAAGTLPLGVIMDVEQQMYKGFRQPGLACRRYLLETNQIPLDKSKWVEQLNKLNLKAID